MRVSEDVLAVLLEDAEIDERAARWHYSGRGMYGRTCFGFTGGTRDLARFFAQLGHQVGQAYERDAERTEEDDRLDDLLEELQRTLTTDSLGLDSIFYFPGVEVDDEASVDADDRGDPDAEHDRRVDAQLGVD